MTLTGRSLPSTPLTRPASVAPGTARGSDVRVPFTLAGREERNGVAQPAPASAERASLPYLDRIIVRSRSRVLFLDVNEVTWLEAYGNYVRFHTPGEVFTVRGTLSSYEQQLDPNRFVRIHRSVIVNRDVVRELHSRRTGDFTLITQSGERLTLSRNFRNRVSELRRRLAS